MKFCKRKLGLLGVAAAFALTAAPRVQSADSLLSWDDVSVLKLYHAYAASDGRSYIEEISLPAVKGQSGGKPSYLYMDLKPQVMRIARSSSGSMIDWHYAGESRHLLLPLQGDLVFDLGDGNLFHLKAGEAMLAEDWTGKGHRSGCEAVNQKTCVVIDVLVDPNPRVIPLRAPPATH